MGCVQACGSAQAREPARDGDHVGGEAGAASLQRIGHPEDRQPGDGRREAPGSASGPARQRHAGRLVENRPRQTRRRVAEGVPGGVVAGLEGPHVPHELLGLGGRGHRGGRGRVHLGDRPWPDDGRDEDRSGPPRGQRPRFVEAAVGKRGERDLAARRRTRVRDRRGAARPADEVDDEPLAATPALVVHGAPGSSDRPTMTTGIGSSGSASSKVGGRRTPAGCAHGGGSPGRRCPGPRRSAARSARTAGSGGGGCRPPPPRTRAGRSRRTGTPPPRSAGRSPR